MREGKERARARKQSKRDRELEKAREQAYAQAEADFKNRAAALDAEARSKMAAVNSSMAANMSMVENPAGVADDAPVASPVSAASTNGSAQADNCRCGHGAQFHQLDLRRHPSELVCHFDLNGKGHICACGHYAKMPLAPAPRAAELDPFTAQAKETLAQREKMEGKIFRDESERGTHLDTLDVLEAVLLHTRLKAVVGYVQGRCIACVETHRTGDHRACVKAWEHLERERKRLGA